jgi:hypothetical protein
MVVDSVRTNDNYFDADVMPNSGEMCAGLDWRDSFCINLGRERLGALSRKSA